MRSTVVAIDRNMEACAGNSTVDQIGLALLGIVSGPQLLPPEIVRRAGFNGTLAAAVSYSGKDDQSIAGEIHISQGYMSRAMAGIWGQWAKRLIAFMQATNSLVPLQWLAEQMGCDITPRSVKEREIAELRARARQLGVSL